MTTEIAIMNKSAVALAADSAVTIPVWGASGHKDKVLNTANKLFSLSKHAPVGIMIYGSAQLMGVPWETIVKCFRRRLGASHYSDLDGYCQDFFAFLGSISMPEGAEADYIRNRTYAIAMRMRQELDEWSDNQLKQEREITSDENFGYLEALIDEKLQSYEKETKECPLSDNTLEKLRLVHSAEICNIFRLVFEEFSLTEKMESSVVSIVISESATCSEWAVPSGIVIAGFGEDNFFPKCRTFEVHAILEGKVIQQNVSEKSCDISLSNNATITPFAQSNDVFAFLKGIAPDIYNFLIISTFNILHESLPAEVTEKCKECLSLNDKDAKKVQELVSEMVSGVYRQLFSNINEFQNEYFVAPILRGTGSLNPSELATMAETLVNLVSFRKQVTMQDETVGGPIDVAIITKGDGLVWIKRKHYFDPSLNHHFFSSYFEERASHDKQEDE